MLPDFYLDIQNGASALLRLELLGVDVGDRWQALAQVIDASWQDLSNPFTTLHVAMVLGATGQSERLAQLLASVEQRAQVEDSLGIAYRDAPAVIRAIRAHRAAEHAQVVENTATTRGALWRLGGSHAQRDVLFQILFDSARCCGNQSLLDEIGRDLERIGFVDPLQRIAYRSAA